MEFNLQQFLSEMRDEQNQNLQRMRLEQREDHRELSLKVDKVSSKVSGHENRIVILENTRRAVKYIGGVLFVGVIGFLIDMLANHF